MVFSKLCFLIIFSVVLIITVIIAQTARFYNDRLDEQYVLILDAYNKNLNEGIDTLSAIPKLLSMHPTLLVAESERQQHILKRHFEAAGNSLSYISLISLDGNTIASWPDDNFFIDHIEFASIFSTLKTDDDYAFIKLDNKYAIISPAFHSESQEIAGYILAILNYPDGLIISSIQLYTNEKANVFILNKDGEMLAHNKSLYIDGNFSDLQVLINGQDLMLQDVLESVKHGAQVLEYKIDKTIRKGIFIYSEKLDYVLGINRPKESLFKIIASTLVDIRMPVILALVGLLCISSIVVKNIIYPIQKIEEHAIKLASHHCIIPFKEKNEVRELKSLRIAVESIVQTLNDAYFTVISALTKAMEEKDEYTQGHALRVAELAIKIGKVMNLAPEEMLTLRYAALLHDIGKLALSDSILLKPEKLNETEWHAIRRHPIVSEIIVCQSPFLKKSLPAIRHHHERYDGNGYPDGLKCERIPLLARIIAVADAFDAMTTNRPYRYAMTVSHTMSEIKNNCGTHFDPIVVDALAKVFESNALE